MKRSNKIAKVDTLTVEISNLLIQSWKLMSSNKK